MTIGDGVGFALQLLGVAVMGLGVWRTWQEFALPDETIFEPITAAILAAWSALTLRFRALWRRIFHRPQHVEARMEFGVGHAMTFNARARVGYGPLDTSDMTAAVAELERRSGELLDRLSNLDERVQDEREADLAAVAELREGLAHAIAELEARDRRVALGGLRLEMLGLVLTVVGVVVATVW